VIIGVPKELKPQEARVSLTPEGGRELVEAGHEVLIEASAGEASAVADEDFMAAGAKIRPTADDVFGEADLIVKVKEPQPEEFQRLRPKQILFTYLHLAANEPLTRFLLEREVTAIAYETVRDADGRLPLLAPMSEIAGRIAPHVSATYLERPRGGRGVLMGGASGVSPATVVVLGAGTAGTAAASIAAGMEADVVIVDSELERLRAVDRLWRGRIGTVMSSRMTVERLVLDADVVIGAVLVPGARAPKLVTGEMVRQMRQGSVLVDISIDQGGCIETAKVTTHDDPVYLLHDVVHYCVGNMPGAVPRTATYALTNATLPYLMVLAARGLTNALAEVPGFASGLNVHRSQVTNQPVAEALGLSYSPIASE